MLENKKLNITIIYQYFGTPKGSWSTRIYELTKRWVKRGHQVTVITSPYPKSDIKVSHFIEKQQVEGINLLIINTPDNNKSTFFNRVFNSLLFAVISSFFLLKLKTDVVIASSGPITVGIPALIKKNICGTPIVFEVRDLWPRGAIELGLLKNKFLIKLSLWFEKLCYLKSEFVVVASKGQEDDILNRFPSLCILNIPNASDMYLFSQKKTEKKNPDWAEGKSIFLHTGSIGLMNNCQQIIDAAKWIKAKGKGMNILILFIGDGANKEYLEKEANKYGLDFVKFIGLVPKLELVTWVHKSTATILTAANYKIMDTLSPNKLFDSFAAGKPIIQTTKGWIKELIENEKCGINVQNDNAAGLGEAILYMTNNLEIVQSMGENAKKVALKYFDRDNLSEKYISFLEKNI